eukprot:Hpha_TRINITY_DN30973_c0_g1::TRINITY_DN30973_c0_g1_i1::g.112359::m.112359
MLRVVGLSMWVDGLLCSVIFVLLVACCFEVYSLHELVNRVQQLPDPPPPPLPSWQSGGALGGFLGVCAVCCALLGWLWCRPRRTLRRSWSKSFLPGEGSDVGSNARFRASCDETLAG